MAQIKRMIRKQARRLLNHYARPGRLKRVRPLLTVWFAVVDRRR